MINKINIETTNSITELCLIMARNGTDKSPLVSPLLSRNDKNSHGALSIIDNIVDKPCEYAHGYTGIYNFLFQPFRHKEIKFGEIGVHYNRSIKGWREWFSKAEIHGFEWMKEFITNAQADNLSNVYYHYINVLEKDSIHKAMNQAGGNFDIIIEDSCHLLETQVNVIETVHSYLNPGGMLIIEDIFPLIKNKDNRGHGDYVEEELSEAIEPFKKYYSDILFIGPQHKYKYTGLYGETRMLILYK